MYFFWVVELDKAVMLEFGYFYKHGQSQIYFLRASVAGS